MKMLGLCIGSLTGVIIAALLSSDITKRSELPIPIKIAFLGYVPLLSLVGWLVGGFLNLRRDNNLVRKFQREFLDTINMRPAVEQTLTAAAIRIDQDEYALEKFYSKGLLARGDGYNPDEGDLNSKEAEYEKWRTYYRRNVDKSRQTFPELHNLALRYEQLMGIQKGRLVKQDQDYKAHLSDAPNLAG